MSSPVFIIAEAGVNHDGSIDRALDLVDCAAACGADAVKFQTFKASDLVSKHAEKAEYQVRNIGKAGEGESQLAMLQKLELSIEDHEKLIERARLRKIIFLSTPFDLDSADLLVDRFNLPRIKVSSGDLNNAPLLFRLARSGKPLILSTGMSSLADIEIALGVIALGYLTPTAAPTRKVFAEAYANPKGRKLLSDRVTLLHCTTEYPAPYEEVNLRVMETLRNTFKVAVGFSDHTPGIAVPIAAAALGAVVIEKHFTLDPNLPGPDHKASLAPIELQAMVDGIRFVEMSLGGFIKEATPSELKNRPIARKSLVAKLPIRAGEVFTEANLTVKRPGSGTSPMEFWEYLGKASKKSYEADEVVTE